VGRPPEGFEWVRRYIDRFGCDEDDARDAVLAFGLSMCAAQSGLPGAAAYARRAAQVANRHGLALIAARSRIVLGNAQIAVGEADDALDTFGEGVVLFEALRDDTGLTRVLTFIALSLLECGRSDDAAAAIARAVAIRDHRGAAGASDGLLLEIAEIELARSRGDLAEAMERGRRGVASRGNTALSTGHVRIMRQLLDLLIADGRLDEALALGAREAAVLQERRFDADAALVLERCAVIIARQGCVSDATRVAACARELVAASKRSRLRSDRDIVDQLEALAPALPVTSVPTIAEAVAIVTGHATTCRRIGTTGDANA
jgi:tetratricopeptide (TPR) repeat protein